VRRADAPVRDEIAGFHLACPWGGGPTVALDDEAGLALLRFAARLQGDRPIRPLGVPETNAAAIRCLTRAGLKPDRYVTRMWLGTPPLFRPETVFGVFNFAVG
jgi:hypothetical protein